jgi:hypothetical protein
MEIQTEKSAQIQVLLKEYERVCSDIRAIETMNDKVVGFGLTLVGAGFAYGVQQNIVEIFFFLPVALLGVLLYAVLQYHNMFWFGGYKRAVEEKVNELSSGPVLNWEALVADQRGRIHAINAAMASIYLTLIVGITWYSLYRIFMAAPQVLGYLYLVIVFELLVLFGFSVRQMTAAYRQAYNASRSALSSEAPKTTDSVEVTSERIAKL